MFNNIHNVVIKTGNDHKVPQTTSKRPQPTTKPTSKRPQTTNKRLQTTNKRTLTTIKRSETATHTHQTKNLTFRFFFPHPLITRNTRILKKHALCQYVYVCVYVCVCVCGGVRIVGRGPTKVSSINKRGVRQKYININ